MGIPRAVLSQIYLGFTMMGGSCKAEGWEFLREPRFDGESGSLADEWTQLIV